MATGNKVKYFYTVTLKDGEERYTVASSETEALYNVTYPLLPEWRIGATVTRKSPTPAKVGHPNIRVRGA